jgi:hypothetical protein
MAPTDISENFPLKRPATDTYDSAPYLHKSIKKAAVENVWHPFQTDASAQELEYYGRRAKKKNPDPGFADFAQSHFRQYERISGLSL